VTAAVFPPSQGMRDARDSGRPRPSEEGHRLSMVHKTSNPEPTDCKPSPPSNLFQVWKDGSLAIFPGIPNLNPLADKLPGNPGGKRGKVLTLSDASRRNLMYYLAKLNRNAKAFTLALTLPGDVQFLTSPRVHHAFKTLCNRLTASRLFPAVGFVWKRELQRRGALHYHLLLYGLEDEATRSAFQLWLAHAWNSLLSIGLSDFERGKHLRWHLHAKNIEAVRGNIAGYFAKYLGKPLESVSEEIPGRWWGKVNAKALPVSPVAEMPLPVRAAVIAHRHARKIKQKRANEAKHRAIARKAGLMDLDGQPMVSQFGLMQARNLTRNLDLGQIDIGTAPRSLYRAAIFLTMPALKGLRWGKAKRQKYGNFSKVRLISTHSPATAIQIMRHVGDALKDWMERNPF